ncbi:UDP-N-acetylmuramate dehydrogenase [Candidatus Wolfebacteria bacterium]|nr:UDP-N-acetylmuramate dehydrogenase [Candidatus Wolfebacteria bacterium]
MFQQGVLLKNHSHYKIGGLSKYFIEVKTVDEIIKAIKKTRLLKMPVFILGGGTNILFNDNGFDGAIIKIKNSNFEIQDEISEKKIIKAEAGLLLADLVNLALEKGFSGLEWAAGLPGTLGGAIRGNAGSFEGEMKDIITQVSSIDISKLEEKFIKRNNQDCKFNYRSSIFKTEAKNEIIIEAILTLTKGDKNSIREIAQKNINYRKTNQPLDYPSIGSIFKNIDLKNIPLKRHKEFVLVIKKDPFPVIPVAYLISESGLKGISCGGAMISPKHPNFIINTLNASSNDVENLIQLIKKQVKNKFNIELTEEIIRV